MDTLTLKCLPIHIPTVNLTGIIQSSIHTELGFSSLPPSQKQPKTPTSCL